MSRNVIVGILLVVVILAVAIGGFKLYSDSQQEQAETEQTPQENATAPENTVVPEASPATDSGAISVGVKQFTVTGTSFKLTPATLTVNKGDKVEITFKNSGGSHDFVLDEFDVKTKVINSGQQEVVTFTADKVGAFEYYCSVGNHRAMGMKGTLTVK